MKQMGEAIRASIKKRLDKTPDEVYNIYKDGERAKLLSHPMRNGRTGEGGVSRAFFERLHYFRDHLVPETDKIADKFNLPKLNFAMAGGSVRDLLVSVSPKDFDVFVDLDLFEGPYTEAEDAFDIFVAEVAKMGDNDTTYTIGESNTNYDGTPLDSENPDQMRGIRSVYTLQVFNRHHAYTYEIIVGRFGGKNPLDIIDGFDYNLVKGGVNIRTGETRLKGEMVSGLTTKTAITPTESAEARFKKWKARSFGASEFKLERTYTVKKAVKNAATTSAKWFADVVTTDAGVAQWHAVPRFEQL